MLEDLIAEIFERRGHIWLVDGKEVIPTTDDVMKALDEVARILHTEGVGARLDVGGMIIDKTHNAHDVYVYVGSYQ